MISFAEILNDGEMQDLNKLNSAKAKDISLRLYSIAHSALVRLGS